MLNHDTIAVTPGRLLPFPHLVCEDVWTDYPALLAALPGVEHFTPMVEDEYHRAVRSHCAVRELRDAFWVSLYAELTSPPLWHLMRQKFGLPDTPQPETDVRLFRDIPRYTLDPHTDAKSKILSLVFYLAEDDTTPEWGTRLLDAAGEETLVPFLPNTMLAFCRSSHSLHAVAPVTGLRLTLQVIYRTQQTGKG